MELKTFFAEALEYSFHFNNELLKLFAAEGNNISERAIQLLNHILNAHHIWNQRLLGNPVSRTAWDIFPLETLAASNEENYQQSLRVLQTKSLDEALPYKTLQGSSHTNTIRDIIFHVINHSTHHRAQISSTLRELGIEPIATDYIFYKRN